MGNCHFTDGALHRTHLYRSRPGIAVHSHTWGLVEMVVDGGVSVFVVCSCLCKIDNVQGHQVIYVGFYQYWEPENLKRTSRHSGQAENVNISGLIQIASCKLMCLTWYFSGGWRSGKYRPILLAIKVLWFCVKMRVEDRLLLGVVVVVSGWWVWVGECICVGSGVKVFLCLAMC